MLMDEWHAATGRAQGSGEGSALPCLGMTSSLLQPGTDCGISDELLKEKMAEKHHSKMDKKL